LNLLFWFLNVVRSGVTRQPRPATGACGQRRQFSLQIDTKYSCGLKNASHLLSPSSRPCTMFDLCHFSSIAVGEGPHVLVSGDLLEPTASICIACLALRPSPKRGRSAMCTSTLLQLLGLSMLTFSDTFETARMYRRATARLRRDACTARMYLVATLLQHHVWV